MKTKVLLRSRKSSIAMQLVTPGKVLHAGSDVRVKVNIVGPQDTTGLMTSQELEMMAATVISPSVDGSYRGRAAIQRPSGMRKRKKKTSLMWAS